MCSCMPRVLISHAPLSQVMQDPYSHFHILAFPYTETSSRHRNKSLSSH